MAKLNKYANLYDKDGNLIRHIDENTGKLEDYTMEELEELVDKLANDKDSDGKVKHPVELNNVNWILWQYYQKYGNPHIEKWVEEWKKKRAEKSTDEQIKEKLEATSKEVEMQKDNTSLEVETQIENRTLESSKTGVYAEAESTESIENPDEIVMHSEFNLDPEYVDFEEVTDDESMQ